MVLLQTLTILCLLSPLLAQDVNDRQWIPVPRRPSFSYDLESNPLEITTDSRLGSVLDIELYHETGDYSLQLQGIADSSPYVFLIAPGITEFIAGYFDLTGPTHEWKIAKTTEQIEISCDNKTKSFKFPTGFEDTFKKPIKEIRFMPGDTATTRYKDSTGRWQDLPQGRLNNRVNDYPLEFKTKNALANKQQTHITLYTADFKLETKVDIHWDHDDYQFWIDECNRCDLGQNYANTSFDKVPAEIEKIWKLDITPGQLNIVCNDVQVYTYKYNDAKYINPDCRGCTAQMNMNFVHFQFNELNDNAAVEYLAPPDCTALPKAWLGMEVESTLPVPYNSQVSVKCSSGYNLTGGDTTILCLGEKKFGFSSQPVCLKDCKDDGNDDGKDDGNDDGKDDGNDDGKDNARQTRNKYLGLGLGSGIAIGLIIALIMFFVKELLTKSSKPNTGAAYVVGKESANIGNLAKV